jgi:2-dehydro-3-deoxyphosphogluconate aldolase / (4S)-4-hydroxy-2-oxoglutarate aldolase
VDVNKFKKLPILGILRGIERDSLEPLIETSISAGLKTIEITMNTENAAELILKAKRIAKTRLTIGAGTVLNMKDLRSALAAGATFIVTPVLIEDVTGYCVKNRIPIFPGALTPKEIYLAWQAGATMVKVFPSGFFGPEYFKEIKGPFNEIELLACGGVTPGNMRSFIANGASAVSFGASVFRIHWIKKRDFKIIKETIEKFIKIFE